MNRLAQRIEAEFRTRGITYVAVDEAKRALFTASRLQSFDFVMYGAARNWLVLVDRGPASRADMNAWADVFGPGFACVIVREASGDRVRCLTLDGSYIAPPWEKGGESVPVGAGQAFDVLPILSPSEQREREARGRARAAEMAAAARAEHEATRGLAGDEAGEPERGPKTAQELTDDEGEWEHDHPAEPPESPVVAGRGLFGQEMFESVTKGETGYLFGEPEPAARPSVRASRSATDPRNTPPLFGAKETA